MKNTSKPSSLNLEHKLFLMLRDKGIAYKLKDMPQVYQNTLVHALLCTTELLKTSNLYLIEELETCLTKLIFDNNINALIAYETLRNIDKLAKLAFCKLNVDSLVSFLIKIMHKKTKLELGIKTYAFEILSGLNKKSFEELLIFDLPFISDIKNIKVKFLLDFFRNNQSTNLFYLLFKNNIQKYEKILKDILSTQNLDFINAFVSYYLNNTDEVEIEKGLDIIYCIFEFLLDNIPLENNITEKKMIKRIFNYFLNLTIDKTNKRRYKIANYILRTNLKNIVFNKKKVFNICKKLSNDKSTRIFELSIFILSIFNDQYLLKILENSDDPNKIKIVFKYMKDYDNKICYEKFLEAKSSIGVNDFNVNINNLPLFAKVFYNFYNKDILKNIYIEKIIISDIYTIDLAMHYSKFFPDKINEEFVAELLFENSSNIVKNIKLIEILTNVCQNIKSCTKNKLVDKLKLMIYQNSYTKCIGKFFYKIKYIFNRENFKNDYILVVYASMNHPDFLRSFNEYEWSLNKLRALIYILQFRPEYGISYQHKIQEIILSTSDDNLLVRYNLLELCCLLTNVFDQVMCDDIRTFYYSIIINNKFHFFKMMQVNDNSIKIQVYKLILKATSEKILLKEETIPNLIAYYKFDNNLLIYKDVIYKNFCKIFSTRILEYKKHKNIYDIFFVRNILKNNKEMLYEFFLDRTDILLKYYIVKINYSDVDINFYDNLLDENKNIKIIDKLLQTQKFQDNNLIFEELEKIANLANKR